jgi:cyanophycinase
MKKYLFLLFFIPLFSFSQGSLVLIGGGGESNGGWSDDPYTWALDQSQNRKVAVIYYSSSTSWISEYFMDLGASDTARFDIDNLTLANAQATYDSLMNYDVFFIKGGNQWDYYSTWKNTKVEDAISDKFNQGGVIMGTSAGMAILSEVIFTAENGSVYPDDAMTDENNPDITLKDDFLSIFPNYIFDTHFVERGRLGRLIPFIKNTTLYPFNYQNEKNGLGVDDRTVICIDSNNIGEVMGSAAVTIIETHWGNGSAYPKISQLINGQKFNFNTFQVIHTPNANQINPPTQIFYQNYKNTLFVCGSDSLEHFDNFIIDLDSFSGTPQEDIYIYTCNTNRANLLVDKINTIYSPTTFVIDINNGNNLPSSDFSTPNKILFYENNWDILNDFLNNTTNGNILKTKLRDNVTVTAFAGQDSKFVGTTFCSNIHDNIYGSYYGELEFKKGLNLIKSSIFMPNTFDKYTSDYYENTQSAVTWAMVNDTLKYGVYLPYNGYLLIKQNGVYKVVHQRGVPPIILMNNGTKVNTTSSYVYSSQNFLRQSVSFKEFLLLRYFFAWSSTTTVGVKENSYEEKGKLLNITNILGEETHEKTNTPLFYKYENGVVEKKIIID